MRCFNLVILILIYTLPVQSQCIGRDSLWKRIIYLKDSDVSEEVQLNELLAYSRTITDCSYRYDSTHAYLLQRVGVMYYLLNDYGKAVDYTIQSIDIIHNNLNRPAVNRQRLINCFANLATYYDSLGLSGEKNKALDSCINISIELQSTSLYTLSAIEKKINFLNKIGDYQHTVAIAVLGEMLAEKTGFKDSELADNILSYHVNALIFLKEYDQADRLLANKIEELTRKKNRDALGSYYGVYALVKRGKGDYGEALSLLKKSYQCSFNIKYNIGCAQALNNIGFLYFEKLNDLANAETYYKKALKFADNTERLNILGNIANIYVRKGNFDSAKIFFQKAMDQVAPGMNAEYLAAKPGIIGEEFMDYVNNLLLDEGNCFLQEYKNNKKVAALNQALYVFRKADELLNKIRTRHSEVQSKLFWRNSAKHLYERAIEASLLGDDPNQAFYFFERSRAVLLNDQLNEEKWLGKTERMKQAQIKKRILQLEKNADTVNASSVRYASLQNDLFVAKQELNRMDQLIKANNPVYYRNFLDTSFVTLQDIQQNLVNNQQSLVEMFNGDSAVYAMFINGKQAYLYKIEKNDFDRTRVLYTSYLSYPEKINAHYSDYVKTASHLYQLIFQNRSVPQGRIVISHDGQYFPFESLITSKADEPEKYFLNDHVVSYTYSAHILLRDFNSDAAVEARNFMGIAPVSYPTAFSLATLGGSDRSLKNISGYFGNAVNLISSEATKNNFMQQFYKYKILQFYTHASDSSKNNEPVIYFADSALYLSDLIGENKPLTRLVVLSACETGLGKEYKGEGVFSFNRGFAALGIPSSVTNLWTVDNESTYKITELFYKYVVQGLELDVALQKAKLEFLSSSSKEKKLPYYWAAAVLVGSTDSIKIEKGIYWMYYAAAIAIPVFFLILFYILRRKVMTNSTPGKEETAS